MTVAPQVETAPVPPHHLITASPNSPPSVDLKGQWDGKANTDAEKILEGAANSIKEVTGLERVQGQKIADYVTAAYTKHSEGKNKELFDLFMESRGNLKEVQRKLGISYPTVRQRIDNMFSELKGEKPPLDPAEILKRLSDGEINVDTASKLIAGE